MTQEIQVLMGAALVIVWLMGLMLGYFFAMARMRLSFRESMELAQWRHERMHRRIGKRLQPILRRLARQMNEVHRDE